MEGYGLLLGEKAEEEELEEEKYVMKKPLSKLHSSAPSEAKMVKKK